MFEQNQDALIELTAEQAMAINGGGATYEQGVSDGAAVKEAIVNFFQPMTDWWYGV